MTETPLGNLSVNGSPAGVEPSIPLPKRAGVRSLLPETWLGRAVKITYTDCFGSGIEASGVLLDWCGTGVILSLAGGRFLACKGLWIIGFSVPPAYAREATCPPW